jgi:hypothetical protein
MTPATSARAAMLATLRAGLAAAPLAVPAPPARPADRTRGAAPRARGV